jgi:uncharacterized membrane protein
MGRQARRIANSDNSLRRFAIFLLSALTWGDVLGCLRTVVVFAAVLLAPGYCLAWACNLLGFRARATVERLAWAVTLSFAAMTIVAVVVAKVVSLTAVCWLAAICATGCALLLSSGAWPLRHSLASKWRLIGGSVCHL